MKTSEDRSDKPFDLNLDALLHPAQAFEHPRDVVKDPDLTLSEKRAILTSWASDARAVEAAAALAARGTGGTSCQSAMSSMRCARSTTRTWQPACKAHGRDASCGGAPSRPFVSGAAGETRILCR